MPKELAELSINRKLAKTKQLSGYAFYKVFINCGKVKRVNCEVSLN